MFVARFTGDGLAAGGGGGGPALVVNVQTSPLVVPDTLLVSMRQEYSVDKYRFAGGVHDVPVTFAAVGDVGRVVPAARYTSYAAAPVPAPQDNVVATGTPVLPPVGDGLVAFPGGGAAVVKVHTSPVVVPAEFFASTRHMYVVVAASVPGAYAVDAWFEDTVANDDCPTYTS